jgi:hypothetical protein
MNADWIACENVCLGKGWEIAGCRGGEEEEGEM